MVAPFVFVDEAIYTELARSLADTGGYAVRELPVSGYSLLYPALIAPAYLLFDSLVDAYTAAKVTNAIVMSLAAVPAYLLARRVVGQWLCAPRGGDSPWRCRRWRTRGRSPRRACTTR